MLPVCYDPYAGTLSRFTRSEIFELVSKGGYEGLNIPVNQAFLGDLSQGEIDDMKKLIDTYNLTTQTVGFGGCAQCQKGHVRVTLRFSTSNHHWNSVSLFLYM